MIFFFFLRIYNEFVFINQRNEKNADLSLALQDIAGSFLHTTIKWLIPLPRQGVYYCSSRMPSLMCDDLLTSYCGI